MIVVVISFYLEISRKRIFPHLNLKEEEGKIFSSYLSKTVALIFFAITELLKMSAEIEDNTKKCNAKENTIGKAKNGK